MGHTPTFTLMPWERAQQEGANGQYAGIFTFTKSFDRMKNFQFSAPVAKIKDVFFKRENDSIKWQKLSDLKGYDIGASAGYNYADVFLTAMNQDVLDVQMVHSETPEILHLRKLRNNRIDLAICEVRLCNFLIEKQSPTYDGIDHIERPIGPVRTFHVGFSLEWPNSEELLEEFNDELFRMAEKGEISKIFRKYTTVRRFEQPLEDFGLGLIEDIWIVSELENGRSSETPLAEKLTVRLKNLLRNRNRTIGLKWEPMLVVWSEGGSFEVDNPKINEKIPRRNVESPDVSSLVQTQESFSLGTFPLSDEDLSANLRIEFRNDATSTVQGGYVLFNPPAEPQWASVKDVDDRKTVTVQKP
jgi:hypothetical protein